ncbi:MtnX-like HAD-IB family phosphatase (plasmid) [Roseomonas gilardii subsp. gilardii]|uniref:MtnX-like HAD-IB family phosphatase n=1 Tax=Roseomonas gilardii TaxID=257708 RepID=UPI001FF8DD82|nr:MtnX-like HAD-IB family phosphatase [Roseomonas gilardii]UPG74566.1 MtnX-like HAD-IB family phosphatase [Roseomonas gilardii subsp. gilardii]
MSAEFQVHIDFDGTISLQDTTDLLLERFAEPAWLDVEAEWLRGAIGSRECLRRQVELLRLTPEAMEGFIASLRIDPGVPDFVAFCRARGLPVTVLSDGLDHVVSGVLRRAGLGDLPVLANRLEQAGADRWVLRFPHARAECRAASGHCKCARFTAPAVRPGLLIGDGRSDFCAAGEAEFVFAKSRLIAHCEAEGIAHQPFRDFAELLPRFLAWLDGRSHRPHAPEQPQGWRERSLA